MHFNAVEVHPEIPMLGWVKSSQHSVRMSILRTTPQEVG